VESRLAWAVILSGWGMVSACNCDGEALRHLGPHLVVVDPQAMRGSDWLLDFGVLTIGASKTKDVLIENDGTGPARITSVHLQPGSDPSFSIAGPATPLLVNPKATVAVHFAAKAIMPLAAAGAAEIDTDDPAQRALGVQLVMTGTSAPVMSAPCSLDVAPSSGDFGTVPPAGFAEVAFHATNAGGTPCNLTSLAISGLGSASFTLQQAPSTPSSIAPGTSAPWRVRYKPSGIGTDTATLTVGSDDPMRPTIAVPLRGTGADLHGCVARFVPKNIDFGTVGLGAVSTQQAALWNFGDGGCEILPIAMLPGSVPEFSAVMAPSGRFLPGSKVDVSATFAPPSAGAFSGAALGQVGLNVPHSVTSSDTLTLIGRGGAAKVCVSPPLLDFGALSVGQERSLSFTVTACGPGSIVVRGLMIDVASSPAFTLDSPPIVPIEVPAGVSNMYSVRFTPTSTRAAVGAALVLTNDPSSPTARVGLAGNVPPNCDHLLACSPARVVLPSTGVGDSSEVGFGCVNEGGGPVTIAGASLRAGSAPGFAVDASRLPITLAPGDRWSSRVTYTPSASGTDVGLIEVDSDACAAPIQLVSVRAVAVPRQRPHCGSGGAFQPVLKWGWSPTSASEFSLVGSPPLVVHLTDDNGDGVINEDDVPSVVFPAFGGHDGSILRAIRGSDGSDLWAASDPALHIQIYSSLAAADLDGDGVVEILAAHSFKSAPTDNIAQGMYRTGQLICFDHAGNLKWMSDWWHRPPGDSFDISGASIVDLDGDGSPEILLGASVFDSMGHLLWEHNSPARSALGDGPLSVAADLDGDGKAEVIAGGTAFRADGTVLWRFEPTPGVDVDGFPIVIDEDLDGVPEVVLRTSVSELWVIEGPTGRLKHGPIDLPNTPEGACGGPIAAADFDGDRKPELAVPAGSVLFVLRPDGTILWTAPIWDYSGQCGAAGASAFDFDGDGSAEVLYADAQSNFVFRGTDGLILYQAPRYSDTFYETPVVADVDGDRRADLIFTQQGAPGVELLSSPAWVGTRPIWNQHAYHVSNISSAGLVPRSEGPGWVSFNAYRSNLAICDP
jgi:hypothetical protein